MKNYKNPTRLMNDPELKKMWDSASLFFNTTFPPDTRSTMDLVSFASIKKGQNKDIGVLEFDLFGGRLGDLGYILDNAFAISLLPEPETNLIGKSLFQVVNTVKIDTLQDAHFNKLRKEKMGFPTITRSYGIGVEDTFFNATLHHSKDGKSISKVLIFLASALLNETNTFNIQKGIKNILLGS